MSVEIQDFFKKSLHPFMNLLLLQIMLLYLLLLRTMVLNLLILHLMLHFLLLPTMLLDLLQGLFPLGTGLTFTFIWSCVRSVFRDFKKGLVLPSARYTAPPDQTPDCAATPAPAPSPTPIPPAGGRPWWSWIRSPPASSTPRHS